LPIFPCGGARAELVTRGHRARGGRSAPPAARVGPRLEPMATLGLVHYRSTAMNRSKRGGPAYLLALAGAAVVLVLVPAAAAATGGPQYPDGSADNGSAADITGVTVASDKTSGQILFRIAGTNLSSSPDFPTY